MTQGLVSVCQNGKVVMKIVTGSDGMNAKLVADAIRKLGHLPPLQEAYDLAIKLDFGTPDSLVVMAERKLKNGTGDILPPLYRKTFNQPKFNPRWKNGTADYIEVVEL